MKIKIVEMSYEKVLEEKAYVHKKPRKQSLLLRKLIKFLSFFDLGLLNCKYEKIGMEKLEKNQPCLILMNHSSFLDLEIIGSLFYDRPYQIVCTLDGMVGKNWLMRWLGCIPTRKFIADPSLIRDMVYAVKKLNSSVVMYPEAGYSFDGTATIIPSSLGKCLKVMGVPVVMVQAYGAFHRQPLYNELHKRRVPISVTVKYLLSPEDIKEKSPQELNEILKEEFSFDNFKWQLDNQIKIKKKNRADGLNRILYKCPSCQAEGHMKGTGTKLICEDCGKEYEMTIYGQMQALEGETEFAHVPNWYQWEREAVRKELLENTYKLDVAVDIYVMVNAKCLYKVGSGQLLHDNDGFHLTGCDGHLEYHQSPAMSYTLNSDFYWYEIGDVISIGTTEIQYYCVPKVAKDIAAKTRLAAEELYKLTEGEKKKK